MSVPQPVTFPVGGTGMDVVNCCRCGREASKTYEGVDPLDFCEDCFEEFRGWLAESDSSEEVSR